MQSQLRIVTTPNLILNLEIKRLLERQQVGVFPRKDLETVFSCQVFDVFLLVFHKGEFDRDRPVLELVAQEFQQLRREIVRHQVDLDLVVELLVDVRRRRHFRIALGHREVHSICALLLFLLDVEGKLPPVHFQLVERERILRAVGKVLACQLLAFFLHLLHLLDGDVGGMQLTCRCTERFDFFLECYGSFLCLGWFCLWNCCRRTQGLPGKRYDLYRISQSFFFSSSLFTEQSCISASSTSKR